MKILVVDDEKTNRDLFVHALADEWEVITAGSGLEAVAQARYENPDLVLLDVMMPEMDGLEAFRHIKAGESGKDLPIIFVTALGSEGDEVRGLELGAVDYLTKPINFALAKLRIRNQLELKRQRDLIQAQNEELQLKMQALESSLARVHRLEGMISICTHCNSMCAHDEDMQSLARYLNDHSDVEFSHGLCPHCFEAELGKLS